MSNENFDLVIDNDREWRKLLLDQNKELFKKIDKLDENFSKKCVNDEKRLTRLEVKSGMWGLIGGALTFFGINIFK